LHGAKLLVLGVAYKRDVSDYRESPALKVMSLLEKDGALVSYHDPYVPELREGELIHKSVELDSTILSKADCVLIITDHSSFDYKEIVAQAQVVVDTRNATAKVVEGREKIVLL
jgi:UDP-N-acetyl-D-glucosamine dehydrogenase